MAAAAPGPSVRLRFRGATLALALPEGGCDAAALRAAVEDATGVPAASQKLITKGKALPAEGALTLKAGQVLMLSGVVESEAQAMALEHKAASRDRVRGLDQEARVQRRRLGLEAGAGGGVRAYGTGAPRSATLADLSSGRLASPFGALRELDGSGMAAAALAYRNALVDGGAADAEDAARRAAGAAPPTAEARALLRQVSEDAGVLGIMKERGWKVGVLTEMPPVGKVGRSASCLLGFNKNRGQEISLRLRTDDLRGFRKYDAIMRTMLHELAHMEVDDHNVAFKELNSQLTRDYQRLNWKTGSGARALGSGGWEDSILGGGR